jgi:hypothetical protein
MPVIPPHLNIDPVLAGLVHCMAFLELSGDDAVDPDWAVEAMEHVAHYLQRLGEAEAQRVGEQLAIAAEHARSQGLPDELVEFLASFSENCGVPGSSD